MIETTTDAAPLEVGDLVEIIRPPAGRAALKVGQRGTVIVTGLSSGLCSVALGDGRLYQLHPRRHLRLVERRGPAAAALWLGVAPERDDALAIALERTG